MLTHRNLAVSIKGVESSMEEMKQNVKNIENILNHLQKKINQESKSDEVDDETVDEAENKHKEGVSGFALLLCHSSCLMYST